VFGSDRTNEDRTVPIYRIEQYEIHVQGYNVTADSEADAISRLFMGEGDPIDNSLEFVEIADDHGMRVDENDDLADQLFDRGTINGYDEIIPSIRCIEEVE
jgi:hypothetical protein